jgi:hypothetical protein
MLYRHRGNERITFKTIVFPSAFIKSDGNKLEKSASPYYLCQSQKLCLPNLNTMTSLTSQTSSLTSLTNF